MMVTQPNKNQIQHPLGYLPWYKSTGKYRLEKSGTNIGNNEAENKPHRAVLINQSAEPSKDMIAVREQ